MDTRSSLANVGIALAFVTLLLLSGHGAVALAEGVNLQTIALERAASGTGSERGVLDPTVASGSKAIHIYLKEQKAFLTEHGNVVKTYRISSGASDTPTPRGTFKIYRKQELRVSKQAVPYRMPYYMAFTKNYAFGLHALPYLGSSRENSAYWQEAQNHIGIPVSHGCVRFLPEEAVEIYEWVDVGVPVYIQL